MRTRSLQWLPAIWIAACGGGGTGGPRLDALDVSHDAGGETGGDAGTDAALDPGADLDRSAAEVACTEGEPCDDGDPCTFGETCRNGVCSGGSAYACDDARDCTLDTCDGAGNCRFELKEGWCLIHGICRAAGEAAADNPCEVCDPTASAASFVPGRDGEPCDPVLDACTQAPDGGRCSSGRCMPVSTSALDCADENPCTTDSCDADTGCTHVPLDGNPCKLGSACEPGTCREGVCVVPRGATCDDQNPCTLDTCDEEKGCAHAPLEGVPCDDANACTLEDRCVSGECTGTPRNCNDGNICTADACDPVTGCYHDLADNACCEAGVSVCDDGDPCTDDGCDPETLACVTTYNDAACDDQDPCTVLDQCSQGTCAGQPKDCGDSNPCTQDSCAAGECVHAPLDQVPCDDGLSCSTGDHCEAGACVADTSQCVCTPTFSPTVSKVTALSIASTGHPGDGLDLDSNPLTCAPDTDCSGGIDNSLGPLASLGNADIQKGLDQGKILILFEHRGFRTDGQPYTLAVFAGRRLDPSNSDCNVQTDVCSYIVDSASFDADCNPLVSLDNAKIAGSHLSAGGKGYVFPFELPLFGGVTLTITLYYARIEADVVVSGDQVTSIQGILGGAVPKQQLLDAIAALPPDVNLPLPKDQIISLLEMLVKADVDGDGDGKKESASIGLKFQGIAGRITGAD